MSLATRTDWLELIDRYCMSSSLSTYDPYDVWKTGVGFTCKDYFNRHRMLGLMPAAAIALFDCLVNDRARLFYRRQEYPIVRALAALSLLVAYRATGGAKYLHQAQQHLEWLAHNYCAGFHGIGWGIGFDHAVDSELRYDADTPFTTITPYCLEAFVDFERTTGDVRFREVVEGIHRFLEEDVVVMDEAEEYMATSYGPMPDRIVTNAVSYAMYAYSLLLPYVSRADRIAAETKIAKLYHFLERTQRPDGSWWYSPQGRSFIDCFHSCIVLKNIIKTNSIYPLESAPSVVEKGYRYIATHLFDERIGLCRRFSVRTHPGIVRYDLYDSAEALNLAVLIEDDALADRLTRAIESAFCSGAHIFSRIDFCGLRRNRDMLRWAVMPYVYATSLRAAGIERSVYDQPD